MRAIAGLSMSTILEEDGDTARIVFPPPPEVLVVPESIPDVVAPTEDIVVPMDDLAEPSQGHPAKFFAGSKPNVAFVLCENFKLERLNTFYVLIKDHAAVMCRNQSDATLEDLRDYLLQQYPDCGLVTPTFSSNNKEKTIGK